MSIDAPIRLDIGLKNLDANLIATEIERQEYAERTVSALERINCYGYDKKTKWKMGS